MNPCARVLFFLALLLCAATAWGQPRPGTDRLSAPVQSLRSAGRHALATGNLAAATRTLETAYRLRPDASGLLLLGKLAQAEKRFVAAQDLARRYLAEVQADAAAGPPRVAASDHQEAARILALPAEPEGELAILGPAGAWILLDHHLVGRLPLSRPLRVAAGSHQAVIEMGARLLATHARVPAGRAVELRAQPETESVLVTLVPALVVLTQDQGVLPAEASLFGATIATVARREHILLLSKDTSLASEPAPVDAPQSLGRLDELARRSEADYVLDFRVAGGVAPGNSAAAGTWTMQFGLYAAVTDELVSKEEFRCAACSAQHVVAQLEQQLTAALALAATRPRGSLELRSEPLGAEVWSDGRRLGVTPHQRTAWTGEKQLELRLAGYVSRSLRMVVEEGKQTTVSIELRSAPLVRAPEPPLPSAVVSTTSDAPYVARVDSAPVSQRARRPYWRLIGGGLLTAAGGTLVGLGASALTVDGSCSPDTPLLALQCRSYYASAPTGGVLLGVGGAVAVVGAVLMLVPGRRTQSPLLRRGLAQPATQGAARDM